MIILKLITCNPRPIYGAFLLKRKKLSGMEKKLTAAGKPSKMTAAGKPTAAGTHTKLTPKLQKRIADLVRAGNYQITACRVCGISEATFCNWKAWGREQQSGIYFEFFKALQQADSDCEAELVKKWQMCMPDSPSAIKDFMERRFAQRWNKTDKIQHEGKVEVKNDVGRIAKKILDSPETRRIASSLLEQIESSLYDAGGTSNVGEQRDLEIGATPEVTE